MAASWSRAAAATRCSIRSAVEANGNICVATLFTGGITVFSPDGHRRRAVHLPRPGRRRSNQPVLRRPGHQHRLRDAGRHRAPGDARLAASGIATALERVRDPRRGARLEHADEGCAEFFSPRLTDGFHRFSPRRSAAAAVARLHGRHVYPAEATYEAHWPRATAGSVPPLIEELKRKARAAGPVEPVPARCSEYGAGLTNLDYAPLCRDHGPRRRGRPRSSTARRPTPATWRRSSATAPRSSKQRWLEPLLDGEIRSRLRDDRARRWRRRTRPTSQRASSATATTTSSTAASGGPRGAGDPRCKIFIVMGKTDPDSAAPSRSSR